MKFVANPKMYSHPDPNVNKMVETKDIVDYQVSEAQKDSTGKPIWDNAAGTYRITGKTLEITVRRGEGAWLEDYIADILLERYDFLSDGTATKEKKTDDSENISPKQSENVVKPAGEHTCSQCGQSFKTVVNLGTHLGAKHPEFITNQ